MISTRLTNFDRCTFNLNCQAGTDSGTNVSNSISDNADQSSKTEELDDDGEWTKLEVAIVVVKVGLVVY